MEIERKFLVEDCPEVKTIIYKNLCIDIRQAYLAIGDVEVRVRHCSTFLDDKYFITTKSKGGLVREEIEIEISDESYEKVIIDRLYKGNIIHKHRYCFCLEGLTEAELDIYQDNLSGLKIIEIEFDTIEEANNFIKPEWFGKEVTDDECYKNKNLAFK